jgi:hypothetical protein
VCVCNKNKMTEDIEMVFSSCVEWFRDWVDADPPVLADEWDLSQWMEFEMTEATKSFLTYGFRTARARNDAVMILRGLYYEYFLFQKQISLRRLMPNPAPVERLPKLPQSNQKSAAWHAESRDMLSGHEFGPVCVGGQGEYNAVVAKKCGPVAHIPENATMESRTVYLTQEDGALSAFKWGWRYEPVARDLFEAVVAEGKVFDGLGRIRHPSLPRLGASPDGLIMDGPRSGRLVEIKCPSTRSMDGKIPIRYYCQMQLQAEVCDIEAVEYVEVQFGAMPQEKATNEIIELSKQPYIGKVCVTAASFDTPPADYKYAYSPLFPATKQGYKSCIAWKPSGILHESSVWYVKDWFTQTVPRNRRWWQSVGYPGYVQFWKDVESARKDGRFKTKPLFIEEELDTGETDHMSVDSLDGADDRTSDDITAKDASGAEAWIGVRSSPETA